MGREASALILVMMCLGGMFISILWLIIGWRIMQAIERMAESFREFSTVRRDKSFFAPTQVTESGAPVPQQDVINRLVQDDG